MRGSLRAVLLLAGALAVGASIGAEDPRAPPSLLGHPAPGLVIDRQGRIRFYTLLDSANFDARLLALRARLDELLAEK